MVLSGAIAWSAAGPLAALNWVRPALAQFPPRSRGPDLESIAVWAAAAAVTFAAAWGAVFAARLAIRRRRAYSHPALFSQLCREHGLDRGSRGLLKRLAAQFGLAQPAQLFVDPKWIEAAAANSAAGREDLLALRARLFGAPTPPPRPTGQKKR